jgi:hypothetical protein
MKISKTHVVLAGAAVAFCAALYVITVPPPVLTTAASETPSATAESLPPELPTHKTPHAAPLAAGELAIEGRKISDPRSAAEFAIQKLPRDQRLNAVLAILPSWGRADFASAAKWAAAQDAALRKDLLICLAVETVALHPDKALGLADYFPPGQNRADFFEAVTHEWARKSPQDAAQWAQGFDDGAEKSSLQSAVAIEWAQNDPSAAAAYIATEMPASPAQVDAARTVAIRWASVDMEAARAWIGAFPDASLREELLHSTASLAPAEDENR